MPERWVLIVNLFEKLFKRNKTDTQKTEGLPSEIEIALGKRGGVDNRELSRVMDLITDQKDLERIAKESDIDQARMWAALRLEDKALANMTYNHLQKYSKDPIIRAAAKQEYKEPSPDDIDASEWTSPDIDIARIAVSKITDQELLLRIVREKNYSISDEAQCRLMEILKPDTEQAVLYEIADSFGVIPLRIKAAGMLEDQELLTKIADKQYFLGDKINEAARKKLARLRGESPIKAGTAVLAERGRCKAGDSIAFGKWDGDPLTWKVLAAESDRLLLLCEQLLGTRYYHISKPATWDVSQLRKDLNGDWFYGNPEVFSPEERALILCVTNDSPGMSYQNQTTWEEVYADRGADAEDHVFLLSFTEAQKYCKGQTVIWQKPMTDDKFKCFSSGELAAPHPWWLRNVTRFNNAAVVVTVDGVINCDGFTVDNSLIPEVRPVVWISK